jgi:hypothetical protein
MANVLREDRAVSPSAKAGATAHIVSVHDYLYRTGLVHQARCQILADMGAAQRAGREVDEFMQECTFTPRVHYRYPEDVVDRRLHARAAAQRRLLQDSAVMAMDPDTSDSTAAQHSTGVVPTTQTTTTTSATAASAAGRHPTLGIWKSEAMRKLSRQSPRHRQQPGGGNHTIHDDSLLLMVSPRSNGHHHHHSNHQHQESADDRLPPGALVSWHSSNRFGDDSLVPQASPRGHARGRAGDAALLHEFDSLMDDPTTLVTFNGSVLVPPTTAEGIAASHRLYNEAESRKQRLDEALRKKKEIEDAEIEQFRRRARSPSGRSHWDSNAIGGPSMSVDDHHHQPYIPPNNQRIVLSHEPDSLSALVDSPHSSVDRGHQGRHRTSGRQPGYLKPIGHVQHQDDRRIQPFSPVNRPPPPVKPNAFRDPQEVDDMVRRARERNEAKAAEKAAAAKSRKDAATREREHRRVIGRPLTTTETTKIVAAHRQVQPKPVRPRSASPPRITGTKNGRNAWLDNIDESPMPRRPTAAGALPPPLTPEECRNDPFLLNAI